MEYLFALDYSTGTVHRFELPENADPQLFLEEQNELGNIGRLNDLEYMTTYNGEVKQ